MGAGAHPGRWHQRAVRGDGDFRAERLGAGGGADQAVIEHWDGAAWTAVPTPGPGAYSDLEAVAASSASNVWAAGSYHAPRTT